MNINDQPRSFFPLSNRMKDDNRIIYVKHRFSAFSIIQNVFIQRKEGDNILSGFFRKYVFRAELFFSLCAVQHRQRPGGTLSNRLV